MKGFFRRMGNDNYAARANSDECLMFFVNLNNLCELCHAQNSDDVREMQKNECLSKLILLSEGLWEQKIEIARPTRKGFFSQSSKSSSKRFSALDYAHNPTLCDAVITFYQENKLHHFCFSEVIKKEIGAVFSGSKKVDGKFKVNVLNEEGCSRPDFLLSMKIMEAKLVSMKQLKEKMVKLSDHLPRLNSLIQETEEKLAQFKNLSESPSVFSVQKYTEKTKRMRERNTAIKDLMETNRKIDIYLDLNTDASVKLMNGILLTAKEAMLIVKTPSIYPPILNEHFTKITEALTHVPEVVPEQLFPCLYGDTQVQNLKLLIHALTEPLHEKDLGPEENAAISTLAIEAQNEFISLNELRAKFLDVVLTKLGKVKDGDFTTQVIAVLKMNDIGAQNQKLQEIAKSHFDEENDIGTQFVI